MLVVIHLFVFGLLVGLGFVCLFVGVFVCLLACLLCYPQRKCTCIIREFHFLSFSTGVDMTLKWSFDNGTTWAGQLQVWPKASGYSSMTTIPGGLDDHIGIIYEKGVSSTTESISFVRVNIYGGL